MYNFSKSKTPYPGMGGGGVNVLFTAPVASIFFQFHCFSLISYMLPKRGWGNFMFINIFYM